MFQNQIRIKRDKISLIFSAVIIAGEIIGLVLSIQSEEWKIFHYYTQDSNILLLIATVLWAVFALRRLRDGVAIPKWVRILKYVATCTVTLTFVVVLTVLAPMEVGSLRYLLFDGSMLWCHTLCPILAIVGHIFFDTTPDLKMESTAVALIPTLIYGVAAVILNILNIWHGPYPFLYVHEQPIWMSFLWVILIIGGAWVLGFFLYRANRAATREYVYR